MLNGNVGPTSFNRVTKRVSHVELNNVEQCWMEMWNNIYHSTWWPNACVKHIEFNSWTMLNGNVESTSFNRVAKSVEHVELNNVEECWMLNFWLILCFHVHFVITNHSPPYKADHASIRAIYLRITAEFDGCFHVSRIYFCHFCSNHASHITSLPPWCMRRTWKRNITQINKKKEWFWFSILLDKNVAAISPVFIFLPTTEERGRTKRLIKMLKSNYSASEANRFLFSVGQLCYKSQKPGFG